MPDSESMGPVELAVIEFEGNRFTGDIVPALTELVNGGVVTILDLVFVTKNADGSVDAIEVSELDAQEASAFDDLDGEVNGLLNDEDLELAAAALSPGSSAALIVWENSWARRLVAAIDASGGRLVAHDRLDAETVLEALAASATG